MGARLVGLTFAYGANVTVLKPNEFRLLAFMALTALDDDTPPRYFDSREAMALGLGRRVEEAGTSVQTDAERTAAFQAVKSAIGGLVSIEAITRTRAGGNGRRAEFTLNIDASRSRRTSEYRTRSSRENLPPVNKKNREQG